MNPPMAIKIVMKNVFKVTVGTFFESVASSAIGVVGFSLTWSTLFLDGEPLTEGTAVEVELLEASCFFLLKSLFIMKNRKELLLND